MNPLAEKLLLEQALATLQEEIVKELSPSTDKIMRLVTLKDCYTHILQLLLEERRT